MSYLKAISAVIALGSFGVRKALDQKRSKGTLQAAWFGTNAPLVLPSGQVVDSGITLDDYEARVTALENEGCDRSDAQGIVDAQLLQSHKG